MIIQIRKGANWYEGIVGFVLAVTDIAPYKVLQPSFEGTLDIKAGDFSYAPDVLFGYVSGEDDNFSEVCKHLGFETEVFIPEHLTDRFDIVNALVLLSKLKASFPDHVIGRSLGIDAWVEAGKPKMWVLTEYHLGHIVVTETGFGFIGIFNGVHFNTGKNFIACEDSNLIAVNADYFGTKTHLLKEVR